MQRNTVIATIVIIISVIICLIGSFQFYKQFTKTPAERTYCIDIYGREIKYNPGDTLTQEFSDCIKSNAKTFLEKDYELVRDLSKAFLTLLSALLIGSITFSEKIINLSSASRSPRMLMIFCWLFLLSAIITCGTGLSLMTVAAGWASYQPFSDFRTFEIPAIYLFISSGLAFGAGLISLLAAGIISMNQRPNTVLQPQSK